MLKATGRGIVSHRAAIREQAFPLFQHRMPAAPATWAGYGNGGES